METPFTCITCRMVFEDLPQQKSHYQTAWHCFNLKRKVAGLAPVTQDIFDEKVAALKGEKEGQAPSKKQPTNNSKKHFKQRREKTRRVMKVQNATLPPEIDLPEEEPAEEETETVEKTEEELVAERMKNARAIPPTESLFDNHKSKDLESNLEYMRKNFGFFIPDIDYLTDLEGLITYLGQKIGIGYACLYCTKELGSVGAIQSHMVDKCHCKINFYGEEEEFADSYDWSPLLGEDNGEEKNTDDKNKQIIVSTEQHSKALHLTETGGELVLPTQKTIGHRDFNLYYKQRHRPTDNRISVLTNQLARQYRDLGIENPQSDVDYVARRKKDLAWMKLGTNANKLPKYMRHNTHMC